MCCQSAEHLLQTEEVNDVDDSVMWAIETDIRLKIWHRHVLVQTGTNETDLISFYMADHFIWKFIWLLYSVLVLILLLRFLLMSTNVIPAQPGSRLQNIVGQIWSLHAQLFNTEMPGVAEPPHYVGRTWHMAVFSKGTRTGYYRWQGENSY